MCKTIAESDRKLLLNIGFQMEMWVTTRMMLQTWVLTSWVAMGKLDLTWECEHKHFKPTHIGLWNLEHKPHLTHAINIAWSHCVC